METGSNQMTISKSSLFRAFYSKGGGHHPLVSESKAGIFTVEKREFRYKQDHPQRWPTPLHKPGSDILLNYDLKA